MGTGRQRSSRVFTISFPEDLAKQVDEVAKEESRNISELFREAFRSYRTGRVRRGLQADLEYARTRNPKGYRRDDVERLVDEVQAEMHAKSGRPVWMKYAGLVESGNPHSSRSIDDIVYGHKD